MKHLCAILLVLSSALVSINGQILQCDDLTWFFDTTSAKCYKLMLPNPVTFDKAFTKCAHDLMEMVSVTSQAQLQAFSGICRDHLNIPAAEEGPGCWLPYKRFQPAPKDSPNFMSIRSDKDRYKKILMNPADQSMVETTEILSHDLWREPNEHETRGQPGDKEDERDEQCTALKNVGGAEAALDSFHCTQHMRHYSVCSNSPYTEVCSMDAFCGANVFFFFRAGQVRQHPQGTVYPDEMYRHPHIGDMINNADRIRLKVYNLEKTEVVEYLVFEAPNNGGLEAWFNGNYVIESSWWDVTTDTYQFFLNSYDNQMINFEVLDLPSTSCDLASG